MPPSHLRRLVLSERPEALRRRRRPVGGLGAAQAPAAARRCARLHGADRGLAAPALRLGGRRVKIDRGDGARGRRRVTLRNVLRRRLNAGQEEERLARCSVEGWRELRPPSNHLRGRRGGPQALQQRALLAAHDEQRQVAQQRHLQARHVLWPHPELGRGPARITCSRCRVQQQPRTATPRRMRAGTSKARAHTCGTGPAASTRCRRAPGPSPPPPRRPAAHVREARRRWWEAQARRGRRRPRLPALPGG